MDLDLDIIMGIRNEENQESVDKSQEAGIKGKEDYQFLKRGISQTGYK